MAPKLPEPVHHGRLTERGKKNPDNDDDDSGQDLGKIKSAYDASKSRKRWLFNFPCIQQPSSTFTSSIFISSLPDIAKLCFRSLAIATVTLYVLNQKHMLPKPMGKVVSQVLFWPTLPITVSRRIGKWTTEVDNAVIIGGAPFGFMKYPEKLAKQFNVRGVVNMCDEYGGPVSSYKRLGIEQLRLPTVDHFEPSVEDLKQAVEFIQKHESRGGRVYVHCRAGHGRSAAAVFAWLLYKEPLADPVELNEKLCAMRNVRKKLWTQPNINSFRSWLQSGGMASSSDSEDFETKSVPRTQQSKHKRSGDSHTTIQTTTKKKTNEKDTPKENNRDNLGIVFSDEESSTTENESDYDDNYHNDSSEDDLDYELWRKYSRK